MTESGGTNGTGTLFKVTTTGIRTTLVSFPSSAMSFPSGGLTLAGDGNFYGSTLKDGFSNYGTLFRFSPGSPALTAKVVFTGNPGDQPGTAPNDGWIIGPEGHLYGVDPSGGRQSKGIILRYTLAGLLHTVMELNPSLQGRRGYSLHRLTVGLDGNFYGVCSSGGESNQGTFFQLTPGGVMTDLHHFAGQGLSIPGSEYKGTIDHNLLPGSDGSFHGIAWREAYGRGGLIYRLGLAPRPVPPPVISRLPGGDLSLLFSGQPGRPYNIERTATLLSWQAASMNRASPGGRVEWIDRNPALPAAFYRQREVTP
jgi:uncharacterized repeat protein (TIGR03803 family)